MSSFKIPKKPRTESGAAAPGSSQPSPSPSSSSSSGPPRPIGFSRPTDKPSGATFQKVGTCRVQTNFFKVDRSKMANSYTRLSMETFLCGGKIEFKLSEGIAAVQGGVNVSERRLALRTIFRKVVQKYPEIFGKDLFKYAYDCATTIYVIEGTYKGRNEKLEDKLEKKDFTEEEWATISRIIRRQNTWFKIILSSNGVVYTKGPKAMEEGNRQELTRLIETVSSEVLNTPEFLQYNSQTFPFNEPPHLKPDPTAEIRSGFDKGIRLLEGTDRNNPDIAMSIDTKLSPFYAPISVLKFITSKYAEFKGISTGGPPQRQQRPGDRGGRPGYDSRDQAGSSQRRRSRSRSPSHSGPRSANREDYDPNEVKEVQEAFQKGNDEHLLRRIEEALKMISAVPTHLNQTQNRSIIIHKFSPSNAANTFFEMNQGKDDQKTISVADYFFTTYNYRLKFPNLPLIVTGRLRNQNFFPMELLKIVPGQRIKMQKMSANVQSSMTGQNATLPLEHIQRIQQILKVSLKMDRNPHLEAFGIQVATQPIQMEASLIAPPYIKLGGGFAQLKPGSVQFRQIGKFARPAKIGRIAVVAFDGVNTNLDQFCARLHGVCCKNGIEVGPNADNWIRIRQNSSDTTRLKKDMEQYHKDGVTLILGITPERKPDVHDLLKYFEASLGLQTQQIFVNTAECFLKDQGGAQTIDNVMRKLNLKCGGVNFHVVMPEKFMGKTVCTSVQYANQKLFEQTQFIGFEMSHGAARTLYDKSQGTFDGEPTIVGCSYTLKQTTDLGGFLYLQEMNEHKLKNLDTKVGTCLEMYQKSAGKLPQTVVVYRTGAGEGDCKRVQDEIQDMKKAIATIQGQKPQLIVVVAQKTSHTRIFPKDITGQRAVEQNVKSGTVIEGQITSAGRNEFILVSQSALIGTVKPIKYTIMINEANWSKNELINVTYFLAFGHQVSYQPPHIPHVLYGAENLAKRGRNNFLTHKRLGDLNEQIRNILSEHEDLMDGSHDKELDALLVDNVTNAMNAMAVKNRNFWA